MPTSDPSALPLIIQLIQNATPRTILDVGCGYGKLGVLVREYLEPSSSEGKQLRTLRVDAVEVFQNYLGPLHAAVYDSVYLGDVRKLEILGAYDLVILADVIEHFTREEGLLLLSRVQKYLITTPAGEYPQGAVYGNEHERHLSRWFPKDFKTSQIVGSVLVGWNF